LISASAALGIDPETGRLALSMALAAVLVPAYRCAASCSR
jgi:hypothetical protein